MNAFDSKLANSYYVVHLAISHIFILLRHFSLTYRYVFPYSSSIYSNVCTKSLNPVAQRNLVSEMGGLQWGNSDGFLAW